MINLAHSIATNRNGCILYEGPSLLDRQPIVVIATGLRRASRNIKTGAMVQTFVIRQDMAPITAVYSGADVSVCGNCALAGGRGCYVDVGKSVGQVYDAYTRGAYAPFSREEHLPLFKRRPLRLGAYGEPTAAPMSAWRAVLKAAPSWTGYTHQWRQPRFAHWRRYLMASVESVDDAEQARRAGWRYFRSTLIDGDRLPTETGCPAAPENGAVVQCADCNLCQGNSRQARSVVILAHGAPQRMAMYRKTVGAV